MSQVRCIEADRGELSAIRLLFTTTVFASAFLLFSVQPMFAKMVLPRFGSSPAVWNTCMVFFQAALLAAYVVVHATATGLRFPHQTSIHLAVLAAAIFALPIAVPAGGWSAAERPLLSLLALLFVALGAPFFALSTIGPLMQGWFARSRDPLAGDPYFLFASSNLGSLMALVSYPTLVEPNLRLAEQGRLWSLGYLLVAGLVATCGLTIRFSDGTTHPARLVPGSDPDHRGAAPRILQRGRWLLLAFIPSSLTLGLTTYLTTDVAPMPLLWVIPLATYLVSFVLTFARRFRVRADVAWRFLPVVAVPVAVTMATGSVGGFGILVPLHLAALLFVSLLCHGELALSRPTADRLTDFYLWLGLGGVLGGVFNAVVAPAIFSGVAEYPLVLVLACLVRWSPGPSTPEEGHPRDIFVTILVVTIILAALLLPPRLPRLAELPVLATVGVPAALCFALRRRPLSFALGLAALLVAPAINLLASGETVYRERSFFGVSQVRLYPKERLALLLSGTTNHGAQSLDPTRRREPLAYYHRTGPIGQIFAASLAPPTAKVAVIGLGTGSLACYGVPTQQFTFYEIDPTVVRIARNTGYFTFLRICPPEVRIVLGDARLSLTGAPDASYDLLVLDAFSSDAIPAHLLTREALALYERKLTAPGLLVIHISNNHLDLEPVLANLAHDAGLLAVARFDERVAPDEAQAGKTSSHWVVLARRHEDLRGLAEDPRWHPLAPRADKTLWTDDFSNLLEVIRWR